MKNQVCPLCGQKFRPNSRVNRDHLIPKAVVLWSKALLPKREYNPLKRYVNSHINQFLVHESCNYKKQSSLLSLSEVRKLHFDEGSLTKVSKMYISLNSQLNRYRSKIIMLKKKQKNRCYNCRRKIMNHFVIRRIDPKKARLWDNACLVCQRCNDKYKAFVTIT